MQVLSPRPELPQFSNTAATAMSMQDGRELDQCARPTLQAGIREADKHRMEGATDRTSGFRVEQESGYPQGGLVSVSVPTAAGFEMDSHVLDHLGNASDGRLSSAFHQVGSRYPPLPEL